MSMHGLRCAAALVPVAWVVAFAAACSSSDGKFKSGAPCDQAGGVLGAGGECQYESSGSGARFFSYSFSEGEWGANRRPHRQNKHCFRVRKGVPESRDFANDDLIALLSYVQEPVYLWCANKNGLAYVCSVVPSGLRLLRVYDSERA